MHNSTQRKIMSDYTNLETIKRDTKNLAPKSFKQIGDIEKEYGIFELWISKNKLLEDEEKLQLIHSIEYIIFIILKYSKLSIKKGK